VGRRHDRKSNNDLTETDKDYLDDVVARERSTRRVHRVRFAIAILASLEVSGSWPADETCPRAIAVRHWDRAVEACRAAYARSGLASDLSRLGYVHLMRNDRVAATEVGTQLLKSPLYGHGHRLMCQIALQEGNATLAYEHGILAYQADLRSHDQAGMLRDALCASQSAWMAGEFARAWTAADDAIALARRLGDRPIEVQAHIARADAFRRVGDRDDARISLDHALALARSPCEYAWTALKSGMLHEEAAELGLAQLAFDRAETSNRVCQSPSIARSLVLNRASLLAGRDPDSANAMLDSYQAAGGSEIELTFLRGVAAGNLGHYGDAVRYLEQAEREATEADWLWEIQSTRGELEASRNQAAADRDAERYFRSAIALVTKLRAGSPTRSAFLVASHRSPYDGLIALLARQQRWREVVALVLELDAGDMLRATSTSTAYPREPWPAADLRAVAPQVPSVADVVAAWRGRELLIVIAPTRRRILGEDYPVVRILIVAGTVSGGLVGSARDTLRAAAALFAQPDDVASALALATVFSSAEDGMGTDTLDVLAVGPLGKVPLAALRDATGEWLLAHRPIARMLSILPRPRTATSSGHAVVLADPLGDLPSAREEGRNVAAQVGDGTVLAGTGGVPATKARLLEARHARLLHVAAHITDSGRSRVLRLFDGDIRSDEILALQIAPRLAVLASCGSGASHDEEGWGSIAAALLSAGTVEVVATDRTIADEIAATMVEQFYAQPDWRDDPARALARLQLEQSRRHMPAARWATFGVLRAPPSIVLARGTD
jgi:tetratricopeptide (TPR) repeat protein